MTKSLIFMSLLLLNQTFKNKHLKKVVINILITLLLKRYDDYFIIKIL